MCQFQFKPRKSPKGIPNAAAVENPAITIPVAFPLWAIGIKSPTIANTTALIIPGLPEWLQ